MAVATIPNHFLLSFKTKFSDHRSDGTAVDIKFRNNGKNEDAIPLPTIAQDRLDSKMPLYSFAL